MKYLDVISSITVLFTLKILSILEKFSINTHELQCIDLLKIS